MKMVFSILLSFALLAGQMYLTIGTHFCGGMAVETKILTGETVPGCDMTDMAKYCGDPMGHVDNRTLFDEAPCCNDEYQTIKATNEFINHTEENTYNLDFAIAFIYCTPTALFAKTNHHFYTEYNSPPIEKEIQVLFQAFLI